VRYLAAFIFHESVHISFNLANRNSQLVLQTSDGYWGLWFGFNTPHSWKMYVNPKRGNHFKGVWMNYWKTVTFLKLKRNSRYLIPSRGICLVIDSPRWTLLSCFGLYTAVYWLSFQSLCNFLVSLFWFISGQGEGEWWIT